MNCVQISSCKSPTHLFCTKRQMTYSSLVLNVLDTNSNTHKSLIHIAGSVRFILQMTDDTIEYKFSPKIKEKEKFFFH